jgi:hypothetical protein
VGEWGIGHAIDPAGGPSAGAPPKETAPAAEWFNTVGAFPEFGAGSSGRPERAFAALRAPLQLPRCSVMSDVASRVTLVAS